jgi:hypothetical protein
MESLPIDRLTWPLASWTLIRLMADPAPVPNVPASLAAHTTFILISQALPAAETPLDGSAIVFALLARTAAYVRGQTLLRAAHGSAAAAGGESPLCEVQGE